jgi:NAD(P)-dependent dehydrogenase (short-subunit alcohol dehydrogenase family)
LVFLLCDFLLLRVEVEHLPKLRDAIRVELLLIHWDGARVENIESLNLLLALESNLQLLRNQLITDWGVKVDYYVCDLEVQNSRIDLIHRVNASQGGLNILINNAALVGTSDLSGWNAPFAEQSIETWRRALEVNLTAAFELSQGLLPLLKESQGGNVVNIASIYGIHAPVWQLYEGTDMGNPAAYGVSKAGLIQLTRWLATSIAPEVRVNAIAPGGIFRNQEEEFVKRYEMMTPLGRMASEDDFRGAIAYLTSDASRYVTGQVLQIDGGWGI